MTARQITDPAEVPAILALLHAAFKGMHTRINPPSSLLGLTADKVFAAGEVWAIGTPPAACMILSLRAGTLYLGKLAVAPHKRKQGLARALIDVAAMRAQSLGLLLLELQTRVELVENHATFRALGFVETARTSHPGFEHPTTITFQRRV